MKINLELVDHIARLSRIELTDRERDLFSRQLTRILEYVDKLKELDTTDVEPITGGLELANVYRKDELAESLPRRDVLANAPGGDEEFFRVPRVIE